MKNHRIFKASYLPCTDTKPSRVKLVDTRHKKTSIFSLKIDLKDEAIKHLTEKNIIVSGFGYDETTYEYIIFSTDFSTNMKTGLKN